MIDLYTWTTPNGRKVPIALEEMGLEYRVHPVDIGQNQQFAPDFLSHLAQQQDPGHRRSRPARWTRGRPAVGVRERGDPGLSGREDRQAAGASGPDRVAALEWTFWQVGGLGPMAGQLGYFALRAPEPIELAIDRFADEVRRLLGVMEGRLEKVPYLAGFDYSIADIASYPWTVAALEGLEKIQPDRPPLPAVRAWLERVGERAAVRRGMAVPKV
jgi:GST-like protein